MLKYVNFMYKQNHLNPSLTGNLLTFKHTFKHVWLRVFLAYCKLQNQQIVKTKKYTN